MQYDDVIAAMFTPSDDGAVAAATVDASAARRLRDALEPLAMHSVWCRATNERLAEFGHNFMTSYVCSRAALLGDPSPGVVVSSFGVFEPAMLTGVYEAGRALVGRDELLRARDEATIASLGLVIERADADVAVEVGDAAAALRRGVEQADGVGRPLFSGLRDQPWPSSAVGQLWRASELFREHRGDSHIAAAVAAGLDAIEMNILTELFVGFPLGSYSASRGWDEAALGAAAERLRARGLVDGETLSAPGQTMRADLEARTDAMQASIIDAVGPQLETVISVAVACSQRCIEAGAFPPNVFKRAAG